MTEFEQDIIKALADSDMSINKAAEQLYFHRNSLVYHIKKIKAKTGLDPNNFYDLCKLLKMTQQG